MFLISLSIYDEFRVIQLREMSSLNLLILFDSSLLFAVVLKNTNVFIDIKKQNIDNPPVRWLSWECTSKHWTFLYIHIFGFSPSYRVSSRSYYRNCVCFGMCVSILSCADFWCRRCREPIISFIRGWSLAKLGRIDVDEKFPPSLAITFLMKGVTGGFVVVRRKVASVLVLY